MACYYYSYVIIIVYRYYYLISDVKQLPLHSVLVSLCGCTGSSPPQPPTHQCPHQGLFRQPAMDGRRDLAMSLCRANEQIPSKPLVRLAGLPALRFDPAVLGIREGCSLDREHISWRSGLHRRGRGSWLRSALVSWPFDSHLMEKLGVIAPPLCSVLSPELMRRCVGISLTVSVVPSPLFAVGTVVLLSHCFVARILTKCLAIAWMTLGLCHGPKRVRPNRSGLFPLPARSP